MAAEAGDPDRSGPGGEGGPVTRRRGAELEAALLDAAWGELTDVGYGAFTMEGVAARASTSRAVLYRRWSSHAELALAAIRQHTRLPAANVPDTGSLREDVLTLLRAFVARTGEFAGILSVLLADHFQATGLPAAALRARLLAGEPSAMQTVLDRAVARGEVDPDRLSPRIASLPGDLVRHDVIMNLAPPPDAALVEIVDSIFLPLIGHARNPGPAAPGSGNPSEAAGTASGRVEPGTR